MLEIKQLVEKLRDSPLEKWADTLSDDVDKALLDSNHGDAEQWEQVYQQLPNIPCDTLEIQDGVISISSSNSISVELKTRLKKSLEKFIPWRKGPFNVQGVFIDTEWRSDFKWKRIKGHISSLKNRTVLDVGCGSGYHGWRMADEGAKLVIGVDPGRLFLYQYLVIKFFLKPKQLPFYMLPLGIEHVPNNLQGFDTVFSMGILYHRKSPFEHLQKLKGCLRVGGELILETIVIDGEEGMTLVPEGRYAKMRNVWFIPSVPTLIKWLQRVGFNDIEVIDVSVTSTEEQRSTDWMKFESLKDFLDPNDQSLTIEGYPAPQRAVLVAKA